MKKILMIAGLALALSATSAVAKTAGTVNGIKITVEDANKALKMLTGGQATWSKLPPKEKKQLITMMAPSKLVAATAKKELSSKEKEAAMAAFWMQKQMAGQKVSDKEAKKAYDAMVKAAKAAKSKQKIPPFKQVKNNIKIQLMQDKVVAKLMKKAKIKVY